MIRELENDVVICSIGDEILIGQILNTNAKWMAENLNKNGFRVIQMLSIGDSKEEILDMLDTYAGEASMVLVTGGLGPTKDDITKATLCEYFDSKLVRNPKVLNHVESFFKNRNKEITELNRKQADVPHNCEVIFNAEGTAPGMHFEKDFTHFIFMPGVPFEMKYIMKNWVIPKMSVTLSTEPMVQKTILTHGIGESFLVDMIKSWEDNIPEDLHLAYLPSPGRVRIRLMGSGNPKELERLIENQFEKLKQMIPDAIFGTEEDTMEGVVGALLKQNHKTVATAESCTGGNIAHLLTSIPGSSAYFKGSIVAYENDVKSHVLGVAETDIQQSGVVSETVVKQMASGVQKLLQTDYALATSGIAGPDGGSEEKPVGTTWIALATPDYCIARKFNFGSNRQRNIELASVSALNLLRLALPDLVEIT